MTTHKVGYLIGSLSKGSINRKLAKALVRLAPPGLKCRRSPSRTCRSTAMTMMRLPPAGKVFKAAIAAVEACCVTPEYNRRTRRTEKPDPHAWEKAWRWI